MKEAIKSVLQKIKGLYKYLKYSDFNANIFRNSLIEAGIKSGDDLYVMCSLNNIKKKTGRTPPVNIILEVILELVGSEGTLLVLAFPGDKINIINKKTNFHWKKSMSSNGIFTELLRRKKESERSLNPIYSGVAYGKNAKEYCQDHHKSIYPFGELSPYRKIIENNGKYLGIGAGFEAFTMVHVLDDFYKENFIHSLYKEVKKFIVQGVEGELEMETNIRKTGNELKEALPYPNGLIYFEKLQPIIHEKFCKVDGVNLFVMDLKSFFDSAIKNYDKSKLTWWNTDI
jgi:aminoglycoside 3-N-acetyltransferase